MTKTEVMQLILESGGNIHESFEHETCGLFDVTEMRRWAQENTEPLLVDIQSVLTAIGNDRYYDESRILELPEDSWRNDPGLFVEYEDGSHLMVDGIHRMKRRSLEGEACMLMYFIPERNIIRPNSDEWGRGEEIGLKWGDQPSPLSIK